MELSFSFFILSLWLFSSFSFSSPRLQALEVLHGTLLLLFHILLVALVFRNLLLLHFPLHHLLLNPLLSFPRLLLLLLLVEVGRRRRDLCLHLLLHLGLGGTCCLRGETSLFTIGPFCASLSMRLFTLVILWSPLMTRWRRSSPSRLLQPLQRRN